MGDPVPKPSDALPQHANFNPTATFAATAPHRGMGWGRPHNPTGKVFSRDELEAVAAVVRRHPRLVVVSDEVLPPTPAARSPAAH